MANEHGSTPAAWTAVVLCLIGFMIGGIGLLLGPNYVLFWIGVAFQPLAAIVGKAMSVATARSSS